MKRGGERLPASDPTGVAAGGVLYGLGHPGAAPDDPAGRLAYNRRAWSARPPPWPGFARPSGGARGAGPESHIEGRGPTPLLLQGKLATCTPTGGPTREGARGERPRPASVYAGSIAELLVGDVGGTWDRMVLIQYPTR